MSTNIASKLYWFVACILVILMIWLALDDEAARKDRMEHTPVVDSVEMENDLKSNAMNAKEKYIVEYGQNIYIVTGVIDNIDPNGDYIFLKSSKDSEDSYMRCYTGSEDSETRQKERMAAMQSGDTITLKVEITDINENFQYEGTIIEYLPTESC